MGAQLKTSTDANTLILTISNPELRNALGPEIYAAGIEALNASEANPDIRSVIITGEGEHFCAGGNLNRLLANRQQAPEVQSQSIEGLHNLIECIRTYPKPVIAAVEGAAAGAGFSLALACDLLVAARNSIFVMAYSTIGLSPDGGGSWQLTQKLPANLALEWMLTAERQSAQRLYELGLINRIADAGDALQAARILALALNQRAPNAMRSIKELAQLAQTNTLHEQLDLERVNFVKNLHHANAKEGIEAFLAKRPPLYQD
ncbi:MAG: enoyl-CoA hydratase [Cytophagales bacterium]|nr:enoyl-CoA hydratase [Cytophagales bacterium]